MNQVSTHEIPFFVTMPHSGERVPEDCYWLHQLPEPILMCDVDRFIDVLYLPALHNLDIPFHKTEWHRYAVDLNRIPEDVDVDSLEGSLIKAGTHSRGYHWVVTTKNDRLMPRPITVDLHKRLTGLIYEPFHAGVRGLYKRFFDHGYKHVFHIDAHSMPSLGTHMHKDPGQYRSDVVISDSLGKSCAAEFKDLVIEAYKAQGFSASYNWPYVGGRVTEQYGCPDLGQHTIQVELNRALYMDEVTKKIKPEHVEIQKRIEQALGYIKIQLPNLKV